jgi:hypothetical protein
MDTPTDSGAGMKSSILKPSVPLIFEYLIILSNASHNSSADTQRQINIHPGDGALPIIEM